MSFIFFAWIASAMYGIEAIIGKLTSRHSISNPWLFNFFWSFFILVLTVPIALWSGVGIPSHWTNIILGAIFYGLGSILYVIALYKLDISTLVPLFSFRSAFAAILGALILGEVLTRHQYLLIGVIFFFGMFVSVDEKMTLKSFFNWRIFIALICMIALVLMAIFVQKAVKETNYWDTTLWVAILGQAFLLLTIPFFKLELSKTTVGQYGACFLTGVAGVIGTLAANAAYAKNVGISATIISLPISMVIAFLFSLFSSELLERHSLKIYAIRFAAAAITIVAALGLN